MNTPLVTVICLCYNHEKFLRVAIESVVDQTYSNIEIIVVDDCSTDNSRNEIGKLIAFDQRIKFLPLEKNLGNCAAFNRGLTQSKGEYVVDFATDDVMDPQRIEKQINYFQSLDKSFGVVFTDVLYIGMDNQPLYRHYDYLLKRKLIDFIPSGDVYAHVLQTYFISAPSMLVRREVFELLNGYDEKLAYEDFDFWVRSSRSFRYAYLDEVLTHVRKISHSLSVKAYLPGDRQLYSTYLVCKKALKLNRSVKDDQALLKRVRYELRHAVWTGNYHEAKLFFDFLKELSSLNGVDRVLAHLIRLRIPLAGLRRLYHALWYR